LGWDLKNNNQNIVVQAGAKDFISDDLNNPIGNSGTQIMRYIGTSKALQN
jgi:hydroxyethylthiazole kinase-like sugar kinase family protein